MSEDIENLKRANEGLLSVLIDIRRHLERIYDHQLFAITVFVNKTINLLKAIELLYDNDINEEAQALVRVLFEHSINVEYFRVMAAEDADNAHKRLLDSIVLAKVKQQNACDWAGVDDEQRQSLLAIEAQIIERYDEQVIDAMRRHGFSGFNVEQRAEQVGRGQEYNIMYRNFSRNIHSSDYVEYMKELPGLDIHYEDGYIRSRDYCSKHITYTSVLAVAHLANDLLGGEYSDIILQISNEITNG